MALDLDTSAAFRRPQDLVTLVRAVVSAEVSDETEWLEWKSGLDLTRPDGIVHIARAVLGLANRMPDKAARHAGGVGYVLVGVSPGQLEGVTPIDPAILDDKLNPYLGGSHGPRPEWSPIYLQVGGKSVLVIIVEPPQWGDPIFCLSKGSEKHADGTVLVRRPGKTTPANSREMEALQHRLRASPRGQLPQLNVELVGALPLAWIRVDDLMQELDAWVTERSGSLINAAEKVWRKRTEGGLSGIASEIPGTWGLQATLAGLSQPDDRTIDEFRDEVTEWAEKAREVEEEVLLTNYLADRNAVHVVLRNLSEAFLSNVELVITFPEMHAHAVGSDFDRARFPSPPRPFGKPKPIGSALAGVFRDIAVPYGSFVELPPYARTLHIEDGSIKLIWDVGDLRPLDSKSSTDHLKISLLGDTDGSLLGSWHATASGVHAVISGTLSVPVQAEPLSFAEVLDPL